MIHPGLGRERGGVNPGPGGLDLLIEAPLDLQRLGPPVAQPAVDPGQARVVAVAAKVGGRHRVELKGPEEVAVSQGVEGGVVGASLG